jgi:hypothetical protein
MLIMAVPDAAAPIAEAFGITEPPQFFPGAHGAGRGS